MIFRLLLILVLGIMAAINLLLDLSRDGTVGDIDADFLVNTSAISFLTIMPSLLALLVSSKTSFEVKKCNPYKVSSDLILFLSLLVWGYLLSFYERPYFYSGASHMYIATWPLLLGALAIFLYVSCLAIQVIFKLWFVHRK